MSNSIVGNNGAPQDILTWYEVEVDDDITFDHEPKMEVQQINETQPILEPATESELKPQVIVDKSQHNKSTPNEQRGAWIWIKIALLSGILIALVAIAAYFLYRNQRQALDKAHNELESTLLEQQKYIDRIEDQNNIINNLNSQNLAKDEAIRELSSKSILLNGNLAEQPKYDLGSHDSNAKHHNKKDKKPELKDPSVVDKKPEHSEGLKFDDGTNEVSSDRSQLNAQKRIQRMVNAKRETTQDALDRANSESLQSQIDADTQKELASLIPKESFIGEPPIQEERHSELDDLVPN